jgi:hypothetical protein
MPAAPTPTPELIRPIEVVRLEACIMASRRTAMPRKSYKPEEIVTKLRQVDVLIS